MIWHVSPKGSDKKDGKSEKTAFQSIERALEAACSSNDKERVIELAEGTHFLAETLTLRPEDSGIVFRSTGEEQAIVSGGTPLNIKWEKTQSGLWYADLGGAPGEWWFRALYGDGKRMPRSRYPKAGGDITVRKVDSENDLGVISLDFSFPCENLAGRYTDLVTTTVWSQSRSEILHSRFDRITTRHRPGWLGHGTAEPVPGSRAWLEHALEFVEEPGEWWLDRDHNRLVMAMVEGDDPNQISFVVPRLHKIVELKGEAGRPVRDVRFEGISFQHGRWDLPVEGYSGIQAGHYGSKYKEMPTYALPLAIELTRAEDCLFDNCEIAHTGASGLGIGAGCKGNTITNSCFFDIGGNAVMVGFRPIYNEPPRRWADRDWANPADAPQGNTVSHCEISDCAIVHVDCVGIWVAWSGGTKILNNHIYNLPYSGLSIGFIWSDVETSQRNCEVGHNHLHDVMLQLRDGAAIYTLGAQPGTRIHHNRIHDVPGGHGVYSDEGSSYLLFEKNLIYNIGKFGHFHHYGHDNVLRENIYANIGVNTFLGVERRNNRTDMTIEKNIIYLSRGRLFGWSWPDENLTLGDNIYWDPRGPMALENAGTLAARQKAGFDTGSSVADPLFMDAKKHDYRLKPKSPARKAGIDTKWLEEKK